MEQVLNHCLIRLYTINESINNKTTLGFIIGEAEIIDCILVDDEFKNKILKENKKVYQDGSRYAFVLTNIKKYKKPIYCKGKLGLWNMEDL